MSLLDRWKKPKKRKRVTVPDAESDMPTISARVPRAVKDWIRVLAYQREVPMSTIVREIMEEGYETSVEFAVHMDDEAGTIKYPIPVPPDDEEAFAEASDRRRTHGAFTLPPREYPEEGDQDGAP